MSSWQILIDYGAGWVDVTNYSGTNLSRDGITLQEKLHDDDFKSALSSVNFSITLETSLVANILSSTGELPCEINKDGSIWFRGFARPVTEYNVGDDKTIDFEIFDYGYKLEKALQSNLTYSDKKLCDIVDTSNSIIHLLLAEAGYPVGYVGGLIGIDISIPVITFEAGNKYSDLIGAILWDYHHVYTVHSNGSFLVYDWSVSSISTTAIFNSDNIINELNVKRKDKDEDQLKVIFNELRTDSNVTLYNKSGKGGLYYYQLNSSNLYARAYTSNTTWPHPAAGKFNYSFPSSLDGKLLRARNQSVSFTVARRKFGLWETVKSSGGSASLTSAIHSDSYSELQFFITDPGNTGFPFYVLLGDEITRITIKGTLDYLVSGNRETDILSTSDSQGRLKDYTAEYIYEDEDAVALAEALLASLEYGRLYFSFSSEDAVDVGTYAAIINGPLDMNAPARIISRTWDNISEIWEYEAVSVGAVVSSGASVIAGEFFYGPSAEEIAGAVEAVSSGLSVEGLVQLPISGDELSEEWEASAAGLYFSHNRIGFNDGEDWTAVIRNDGSFLFQGDANNYIEWNGTKLHVQGDMFLSGDSTIAGNVAVGEDLHVDGTVTVGAGGVVLDGATGSITATVGEIGGWEILTTYLQDTDNRLVLNSEKKRAEVKDVLGNIKVALGYLDGIEAYTVNDYGLWIGAPNTVHIEGDADYSTGDWSIKSDGAFVVKDGDEAERGRLGSLGGGRVGLKIGDIDPDAGTGKGIYADETGKAVFSGSLTVGSMPILKDDGLVAHWSLDDGSGLIAADNSGGGNDGTLIDSPTWTDGVSGKALTFDGNNYVETDLDGQLYASGTPWTYTFWADATGVLLDNGNVKIEKVSDTQMFVTIRGFVNDVEIPMLSGYRQYTISFDGTDVTLSVDAKPAVEQLLTELYDSDGLQILDTDDVAIDPNYDYWRIA